MPTTQVVSRKKTGNGELVLKNREVAPNELALRNACLKFDLKIPPGKGEVAVREMLGLVRTELANRLRELPDDQQIECPDCYELSTMDTDTCPYCGSTGDGDDSGAEDSESDDGRGSGVGIATVVETASAEVVDAGAEGMAGRLSSILEQINVLKRDMVGGTYDLGLAVKTIRDEQLYKARGYTSFSAFAQKELPFTRETALQLVSICEKFGRGDYVELGFAKLRAIASVSDSEKREKLVEEAKVSKLSSSAVKDRARTVSGKAPRASANADTLGVSAKAPPVESKDGLVTVLARLGGQPRAVGFISSKTNMPMETVGVEQVKEAFAEVRLSDDVVIRIGLRVDGKKISGLTVRFERAE